MARDRQRAKQRKARRAQNPGQAPSRPRSSNPPNPLDHNVPSELGHLGEVDEFEAAIVRGAEDAEAEAEADAQSDADDAFVEEEQERQAERLSLADGEDDDLDEELEQAAVAAAPIERQVVAPGTPGAPTRRGPARFIGFLRASWAELQRVQWPDRRQVTQATAVVMGFVVVAGLYLGVADWVAKKIVDYII